MSPANPVLRVFVLEDEVRDRDYLRLLLERTAGFDCVGCASTAQRALRLLPQLRPDVVLVDLELPGLNGTAFLQAAGAQWPDLRFLVVTQHDSADFLFPALVAGADGYLLKTTPPSFLLDSIREVHEGGAPMSPAIARRVLQNLRAPSGRVRPQQRLSVREIEILTRLTRGFQQKEIAESLGLSARTVATHLGAIYRKLHVHNAAGAVAVFLGKADHPDAAGR